MPRRPKIVEKSAAYLQFSVQTADHHECSNSWEREIFNVLWHNVCVIFTSDCTSCIFPLWIDDV